MRGDGLGQPRPGLDGKVDSILEWIYDGGEHAAHGIEVPASVVCGHERDRDDPDNHQPGKG
jgi:hypothetical protein